MDGLIERGWRRRRNGDSGWMEREVGRGGVERMDG